jgi:hypothetical protein
MDIVDIAGRGPVLRGPGGQARRRGDRGPRLPRIRSDRGARARGRLCGQISPWNYPLLQASWKLAPALASGNTVVVKPSELTPLSTIRLFELLDELSASTVRSRRISCWVPETDRRSQSWPSSNDVDHRSRSPAASHSGRDVMRAAAGNVKKIALELGGKNPNIVFADADLPSARSIYALLAVFLHAGQVCSAGARLLVEASTPRRVRRLSWLSGQDASGWATGATTRNRERPPHLRCSPGQGGDDTWPLRARIRRHDCSSAALVPDDPDLARRLLLPADDPHRLSTRECESSRRRSSVRS